MNGETLVCFRHLMTQYIEKTQGAHRSPWVLTGLHIWAAEERLTPALDEQDLIIDQCLRRNDKAAGERHDIDEARAIIDRERRA